MKSKLIFLTVCMLMAGSLLISCKKNEGKPYTTAGENIAKSILPDSVFKGPKKQVFGGKAWVWVKLSGNGAPRQLAITITNSVLTSAPPDSSETDNEIVIPAPQQANITAFHDFAIDWNPQGLPPADIYGLPLFNFHFYTITDNERQAIPGDPDYAEDYQHFPAPAYLPKNYDTIYEAGGIPGGGCIYGRHWYKLTAPEFQGKKFTQTFVYGTYNGRVDFYDPMMTLKFLKNVQSFERNIPQPAKFTPNGYYPTKLTVLKHDGVTDIILGDFVLRPAS